MKSSVAKAPSCCVMVKQRICYRHEPGCMEPDLALGWIIKEDEHDSFAQKQILDALEEMGFTNGLARKV